MYHPILVSCNRSELCMCTSKIWNQRVNSTYVLDNEGCPEYTDVSSATAPIIITPTTIALVIRSILTSSLERNLYI